MIRVYEKFVVHKIKNKIKLNMKKNTFISLVLFLWTTTHLLAGQPALKDDSPNEQVQIRVIYHFSQKAIKDKEPIFITDTMALDIGNNWSVYYDWNKARRDSLSEANFKNNPRPKYSFYKDQELLQNRLDAKNEIGEILDQSIGESMLIFKNRKDNEVITIDEGPLEGFDTFTYFKLIEQLPPSKWEVAKDTCTILGYSCHKAFTSFRGRNYGVWFTMDIPINEGPWKLYGLPGLILRGEDENSLFSFEAIGLQEMEDIVIGFPTDKKIVPCKSLQELHQFRKKRFKNISIGFVERDGSISFFKTKNPVTFNELESE